MSLKKEKLMNKDVKKVLEQVKASQAKLLEMISENDWVSEARSYAHRQSKELKKVFSEDVKKVQGFLEQEKKSFAQISSKLPKNIKNLFVFLEEQKKEFSLLLSQLGQMSGVSPTKKKKSVSPKKSTKKRVSRKT
jgi:hypothetical protein